MLDQLIVLDAWIFTDLAQVCEETQRWLEEYNTVRPYESLGDISPLEFLNDSLRMTGSDLGEWTERLNLTRSAI